MTTKNYNHLTSHSVIGEKNNCQYLFHCDLYNLIKDVLANDLFVDLSKIEGASKIK